MALELPATQQENRSTPGIIIGAEQTSGARMSQLTARTLIVPSPQENMRALFR